MYEPDDAVFDGGYELPLVAGEQKPHRPGQLAGDCSAWGVQMT